MMGGALTRAETGAGQSSAGASCDGGNVPEPSVSAAAQEPPSPSKEEYATSELIAKELAEHESCLVSSAPA